MLQVGIVVDGCIFAIRHGNANVTQTLVEMFPSMRIACATIGGALQGFSNFPEVSHTVFDSRFDVLVGHNKTTADDHLASP
jgi:hypothetical protein